jgi:hypothetical protein
MSSGIAGTARIEPATHPYESASPAGPIMPVTCGNRLCGWSVTAKVTAKW